MDDRGGRKILVVEDDKDWREIIAGAVEGVLDDMGRGEDDGVVLAENYQQAAGLLKHHMYTLVSMDVNLTEGQEAAEGLELLGLLEASAADTFSVIVSAAKGEAKTKSVFDGFQKYNILRFFDKSTWQEREFRGVVKGILLYADALRYLAGGDLDRAVSNWESACKTAPELRKRFQDVGALRARLEGTDLVTGLPAGKAVDTRLRELLKAGKSWGILYIRVHGLEEYYETYGHIVGDSALKTIGRFLKDEVGAGAFVGYAERGLFAVIVKDQDPELLKTRLVDRFNREHAMDANLYPYQDRGEKARTLRPGVPELKLAIRMVSSKDGPFPDIREISRMGSGVAP